MKRRKILLVEDNQDDIELALEALARNGVAHDVEVVRDGAAAIRFLHGTGAANEELPQLPAVILLDLNLPMVHGLDVLRAIRAHERTRTTPCVILTTSVEESDVSAGYRLGVNAYVQKQIGFEDFISSLSRVVLFWMHTNVLPRLA
jgi:two-component system response regulator